MKKENGNRQLWRKLGLAAASAVLALGASEVVVRLFVAVPAVSSLQVGSQQSAYVRSSNPVLGYELKASHRDPEAAIRFKNGYGHWRDHTRFPYTNAHGQRDLERSFEKPEGVKRILVLGDSVVAGHGILDLNDTISRQLEQAIDAKHEVEVLNLGVGGYCTRGEVELLREKGLKYSPDLVVVVFVENDFQDFNTQFRDDRGYRVERPAILNSLFKSSSLFRKASLAFNLSRFREEFDPQYSMDLNQLAVGENNVVEGFRLLDTLREQHDFAVAIAIWPHFGKSRIIDRPTLSSHMLVVEDYSRRFQLPTFRLSHRFAEELDTISTELQSNFLNPQDRFTVGDGMHPNETGAKIAALAIHDALSEYSRGLFDQHHEVTLEITRRPPSN